MKFLSYDYIFYRLGPTSDPKSLPHSILLVSPSMYSRFWFWYTLRIVLSSYYIGIVMGKAKKKSLSKRRESRFKKKRVHIPDQIRATLIDLVVNRGLSLAEAGQRVQPRLSKSTVSTIISNFRKTNRYSAEISHFSTRVFLYSVSCIPIWFCVTSFE